MSHRLLLVGAGTIGRIHVTAALSTGRSSIGGIVDRDVVTARELAAALPGDVVVAPAVAEVPRASSMSLRRASPRVITPRSPGSVSTGDGMSWWRSQSYYDSAPWRGTWAMDGGGAVMNQGIHTLDLLVWLLGRPVEISAASGLLAHERIEVEDTAGAVISFESGAIATFSATTVAYPGVGTRLLVVGHRGSLVIEDDELTYRYVRAEADSEVSAMGGASNQLPEVTPTAYVDASRSHAGHARQYADVADAIDTGRRPGVTVDDAVVTLSTVRAVYASSRLGRAVRFEDVLRGDFDDLRPDLGRSG